MVAVGVERHVLILGIVRGAAGVVRRALECTCLSGALRDGLRDAWLSMRRTSGRAAARAT